MVCWLPGKNKYFSFPRTMAVRWAKRKWTRRKINWRQRRAGKVFTADRSDGCHVIMVYKLTARAPVPVCVAVMSRMFVLNKHVLPALKLKSNDIWLFKRYWLNS